MARIGLNWEPVALSAETVDKLIGRGSGDAALLYLYPVSYTHLDVYKRQPPG